MNPIFHEHLRTRKEFFERARRVKLPLEVRVSSGLIVVSLLLLAIGNWLLKRLRLVAPDLAASVTPELLRGATIVAAVPGVIGMVLSIYTVARYPDTWSRVGGTLQIFPVRRWLWCILGGLCYLIAIILTAVAITDETLPLWPSIAMGYAAMVLIFVGYLLTFFRAAKHPAVATFLYLTAGMGVLVFPLYIPSLIIGTIRYHRIRESQEHEQPEDASPASPGGDNS